MPAGKKRGRTQFSRARVDVGTVVVRYNAGSKGDKPCRYIKVSLSGPPQKRWMLYARWLWETKNGPCPKGFRIGHLDGDMMNDDPSNLAPMRPGDVVGLAHLRDPKMSERNYRKCRAATARENRARGRFNRRLRWMPSQWYAVFPAVEQVLNITHKKAIKAYRACGVAAPWRTVRPAALGWPGRDVVEACILVVAGQDERPTADVIARVNLLRQSCGWERVTPGAVYGAICKLRRDGLIDGGFGMVRRTELAGDRRSRTSPVLVVKGSTLQTVPMFQGYRKVERLEGVCQLCGTTEQLVEQDRCFGCLRLEGESLQNATAAAVAS